MSSKIKKVLAVILAAGMLSGLLAACSGNNDTTTTSKGDTTGSAAGSSANAGGESFELSYQYWDLIPNQEEVFAKFTEEYKKETGNTVTIKGQLMSEDGWEEVLKSQIANGEGADVFHLDLGKASVWQDTVIQPLNSYYDAEFWDQFIPSTIEVWKKNDQYYAVPNSFSVVGIYYNKDMFKEAGIEVTSDTRWTLAEFESAMEKLHKTFAGKKVKYTDGNEYDYVVLGSRAAMYWLWMMWNEGGIPLDQTNNIAQKAYADAIVKMAEYKSKGYIVPEGEVQPGNKTTAFAAAGNVGMIISGDWTATAIYRTDKGIGEEAVPKVVNYGSLTVPKGSDGKVRGEMYNQGVVMNKNLTGAKAEAAAAFIKYMTTGDAWLDARGPEVGGLGIPARTEWAELYANSWFGNKDERSAFVWTAENGVISSSDHKVGGIDTTAKIDNVILTVFESVTVGNFDKAAVEALVISELEKAQAEINEQLEENDMTPDNPEAVVK